MSYRARLTAVAVCLFTLGAAAALAVSGTTGTVVACAHATVPAQTIAVNGNPIATVPQQTADQCSTVTYTVPTVTVTDPATTTATTAAAGPVWPDTTPPPMGTPTRVASTPAEFASVMGSLNPGDVVEVKPMTLTGEQVFARKLSAPASVYFDDGVKFTGAAAGSLLPAVWIHGSNLYLYGGDVTGLGNDCVRVGASSSDTSGPTNIRWWGVKLHGCGGDGFSAQAYNYPNSHLDIQAEIWGWSQTLSLDPHTTKGTGLHGAYVGGGNAATTDSRFEFYVHDSPYGSGVQAGSRLVNSDLWIRAANLTWAGTPGLAGNAFQPWGSGDQGVTVDDLEVSNVTGHAVFDESLTGGSLTVQYARSTAVGLSPVYEQSQFLSCVDCQ